MRQCGEGFKSARGVASVEFALVTVFVITLLFCSLEAGRMYWLWNSAAAVTARGARLATVAPLGALDQIRRAALLQPGAAGIDFGFPGLPELAAQRLRVTYLAGSWGNLTPTLNLPTDGVTNRSNCALGIQPCIQAVQVAWCQNASGACTGVPYQSWGLSWTGVLISLPTFPATLPLQAAGATSL